MLVVDDILASPFSGLFWIFREIRNAATEELASQKENITIQLSELYIMLETGQISEEEFEERELELLDRLDEIEERESAAEEQ